MLFCIDERTKYSDELTFYIDERETTK